VLAASADEFARKLQTPRAFAGEVAAGLVEYLARALSHRATLAEPKDLAWLLASYTPDGLARVEAAGDAPSLAAVRAATSAGWFDWPALPDLFPVSFPGVKTSRDGSLVGVDLDRLKARIADYRQHVFEGNVWLSAAQHLRRGAEEPQACFRDNWVHCI